ncbi:hypothetical protein LCGC14_0164390 [marine sediment metagenome]|uniref:Uncharacterized protein n=1 Tax=marine sediment metagenome TaxID=412755 RepID=A0A0F9UUU3_9ZZZZ
MARYNDLLNERPLPEMKYRCWFRKEDPRKRGEVVEATNIEAAAKIFAEEWGDWEEGVFDILVNPVRTGKIYNVKVSVWLELNTETDKVTLTRIKLEGREKPKRRPRKKKKK